MQVRSLDPEDPLEKEMATHPSILAWEIPRREEPGRLQTMRSQRHDLGTKQRAYGRSQHPASTLEPKNFCSGAAAKSQQWCLQCGFRIELPKRALYSCCIHYWGCPNWAPQTGWLTQWKRILSAAREAGRLRSRCGQGCGPETSLSGL